MQQILIDTLRGEIENLREQIRLIENRVDEIEQTLSSVEAQCVLPSPAPETEDTPEEEQPEVEVEFYVDDTAADEEELLTEEELEVEDSVEDVLVEEIEKDVEEEAAPAPEQPKNNPSNLQNPSTMSSGISAPSVDDIRKGMSLGDRFLFQRELFGGDGEKMNKTIDQLNSCSSLDEAMHYVGKRFQWDTESQAYELFVNILKRRFQ
ncbi:MAG: hypothetical protein IJ776_00375 [Paludibacteraceae bacterium]|nr:hypothetical protein [Paludibacteraceae bacterium]